MSELAWSWERVAMNGSEMPEGLSLPEQMAFISLRGVYQAYYRKTISREAASAEKKKIRYQYNLAAESFEFEKKLLSHHVKIIKATEAAISAFRKAPSIEAGLQLCDALDGLHLEIEV